MTFYWTDTRTGELKPVLAGLKPIPRHEVKRSPVPRARTRTPQYRRRTYRRENPLEHLVIALAGVFSASVALAVPFLT